jgi:hypothetical protein
LNPLRQPDSTLESTAIFHILPMGSYSARVEVRPRKYSAKKSNEDEVKAVPDLAAEPAAV